MGSKKNKSKKTGEKKPVETTPMEPEVETKPAESPSPPVEATPEKKEVSAPEVEEEVPPVLVEHPTSEEGSPQLTRKASVDPSRCQGHGFVKREKTPMPHEDEEDASPLTPLQDHPPVMGLPKQETEEISKQLPTSPLSAEPELVDMPDEDSKKDKKPEEPLRENITVPTPAASSAPAASAHIAPSRPPVRGGAQQNPFTVPSMGLLGLAGAYLLSKASQHQREGKEPKPQETPKSKL
eukprot:TRINITY_DN6806_c0_g2_i1.p1 TRINITY_DN6806_c0_g2~~TRINITY_DN6806_c0_g2_i1.p1  ORF type:complete len:258 (+),score=62.39 TRINITY_DN6806_c0_g2_i1:62-775(+)